MSYFHWITGSILSIAWLSRLVGAALGMPKIPDISRLEWDRNPVRPTGNPRVSIIVPACNEEEAIEQALTRLLDIAYDNYEIIAVNDRSTDRTGEMLDRIAAKYGRKLYECPIGFKHIADLMMEREIVIGGEESGGIGYSRYLPERDGILNSLLLANVMADEGKTLGQLVSDLQKEFGPHFYGRIDMHIPDEVKNGAIQRARSGHLTQVGRYNVVRTDNLDGIKFFLDAPRNGNGADAWILFRASGTEPLLRIYAEAASQELVKDLLTSGETFVMQKSGSH